MLWLIAFADRNPAYHKDMKINSIALHSTARAGQTQTQEDCVTRKLESGQARGAINAAHTIFVPTLTHNESHRPTDALAQVVFVW